MFIPFPTVSQSHPHSRMACLAVSGSCTDIRLEILRPFLENKKSEIYDPSPLVTLEKKGCCTEGMVGKGGYRGCDARLVSVFSTSVGV